MSADRPLTAQPIALPQRGGGPRGRQPTAAALLAVRALLGDESRARDLLIEHLHKIQDSRGHLSVDMLAALAEEMKLSQAEVHETASFYHHFDIVREGEAVPPALTVRVCNSLSCAMAGAKPLLDELRATAGADLRIVEVPCVGRCAEAPVAVVGQKPVTAATPAAVRTAVAADDRQDPTPDAIGYEAYRAQGGYRLLDELLSGRREVPATIQALTDSGLRGLGGAGFPLGRKWAIVGAQAAPRLLAINIDEGEPGTFKDRHYLERDPHRFLEGALIAAHCVGVAAIYIYLRDEYAGCRALLQRELELLRAARPDAPEIHLRRGAGAYVCGEESAMIESLEGKRGWPRQRPPYLAEVGLFGRPTLEHNMETLHWVREILERGADWFAAQGRRGRKGLRSFSLSGRVNRPGMHVAPAGISLRELVDEYGGGMQDGHELYGYFPGGASGGIFPASMADLPLDFDTLQPHGCFIGSAAIIVFSQADRARELALNAMEFFEHESCGQCTPCREGTQRAVQLMRAPTWDVELMDELSQVMMDASICGLGQAAPNPLRSALRYFPQEFA
ncbi:NADH-ubiquinone oxidoreductase-F iron-sulfur binding region domain-containing protein [Roseateles toxinivorans]|uniref:NAD-dependent formate dehydrogenase flavoprotein subunit n=1 Tax=Roseateles toxinivorans TaxID=270368 RepID=A0A4R6QRE8_9BURK|nr:NADH-ubiquinone oxidoreductase-F iron-sulfur binding region domain-containing protein [Roseateles toxinivorans]TDP72698.1 NAD-dependent formate dehydrogenase flavoprotein subunit [Roseateles toxinivorans]